MILLDLTHRLPRTTTRAQWKAIHRRKRVLSRGLTEQDRQLRSAVGALYDHLSSRQRAEMIERLMHPLMVVFPDDLPTVFTTNPRAVNYL